MENNLWFEDVISDIVLEYLDSLENKDPSLECLETLKNKKFSLIDFPGLDDFIQWLILIRTGE